MQLETEEYMTIERVNAVRERAGKLRRQFLKYKDAESVYSLTHRKVKSNIFRCVNLWELHLLQELLLPLLGLQENWHI